MNKRYYLLLILYFFYGCTPIEKHTVHHSLAKYQITHKIKWLPVSIKPQKQIHVVIIIDVFRAFTTAAYILERYPATYILASKSVVISSLAKQFKKPLLIGKAEKGVHLRYDIPNSPTRVQEVSITGRNILHRTEAGAKGILLAKDTADLVLAVSFVNADATVNYIQTLAYPKITIIPMGHEGLTPSLEDNICAQYIKALINGKKVKLTQFLPSLKNGPGQYFFSKDQWQYPSEDFTRCLEVGRFNFVIRALIMDNYAILTRVDQIP